MTEQRTSRSRGGWRLTAADVHVAPPVDEVRSREGAGEAIRPDTYAPNRIELWERENRAFFSSRLADGTLARELSAGPGYLRDHDHIAGHQVIRESGELERDLEIVRATFGPMPDGPMSDKALESADGRLERDASGMPRTLSLDGFQVTWRYEQLEGLGAQEPYITRRRGYSWEIYGQRDLPYLGRLLGIDLPRTIAGFAFEEGFLYASSWFRQMQLHVVWPAGKGDIELVVADVDVAAQPSAVATVRSATGTARMADLRAPDRDLLGAAAAAIELDRIVGVRAPMPVVEGSIGAYRIVMRALPA